ncbi:MAG: alpha-amylase family glycosyl hydrolase, partial [Paludibacteraceae bacterium]|nr:alpha-amylase family glycosyl hydrolase [Paludibacteraceae bacterium]
MKRLLLLLSSLLVTVWSTMAQVTTDPAVIPQGYKGKVVVTFDPAGTDMAGQTTCYAHTGVTTKEKGNWTCAPAWGTNTAKYKLTKSGTKWVLTIDNIYTFYDCAKDMEITGLNFVFRNEKATKQSGDILCPFGFEDKAPTTKTRPAGITDGIFYDANDPTKVTVSLYVSPSKSNVTAKNVYILCDANYWNISNDYQCYKDGNYFWYTFTGLTAGKEYAFQYGVKMSNGSYVQISDPYSTKVLHGDDKWEPKTQDPTLMDYPNGGSGYVTVIQPGKKAFNWSKETLNFKRPNKNNLVIYEIWPYTWSKNKSFKSIIEKIDYLADLGINALEFMPLCEFDGNLSWGYSPNHYFAIDKAYGTEEQFKTIVDECHKRGIAVIVDMVFNHATGNHPFERLYGGYGNLKDNPYFNV